jgi:hypothetical protein
MVQHVPKQHAANRHAELRQMTEVALAHVASTVQLRKEDFLLRPFGGPPVFHLALKSAQLAVLESTGIAPLQILE